MASEHEDASDEREEAEDAQIDESEVEELAESMHRAANQLLLSKVASQALDNQEVGRFLVSLSGESDRALAIVSVAYLEDQLKQWLSKALNAEVTGGIEALFQGFGPLSSFSSKIRMTAALGWISKPIEVSLDALRRIRNEFAHRPFITGFDDPKICSYLDSMPDWERPLIEDYAERGKPVRVLSRREIFHLRYCAILMRTLAAIVTAPLASSQGLHPMTVAEGDFDDLPENIRELCCTVAMAVLDLVVNQG